MKKILSILLVLAIVLGCVLSMTACGKKDETANTTEATTEATTIPQKEYTIEEVAAAAEEMKFTGHGLQTAYCPKCNEVVPWGEITETSAVLIGAGNCAHYYLGEDVYRPTSLFAYNGSACIFFNGYTLTFDGSAEGHALNTAIGSNAGSEVTLMGKGGIISENRACAAPNGGVLNICGGVYETIIETDVTLRTNHATSELYIYKATVKGDVTYRTGNPESKLGIFGEVTMDTLNVESGAITIGTLPEGTEIAVNAEGKFTHDFESVEAAEAAAKCFVAADDTMKIVVEGKALSCVAK